jgi:crossover junction endodeoxyribonuclease RuvC
MTRRILGIDPGLRATGWGIIQTETNHLRYVACGCITPSIDISLAMRLKNLHIDLMQIIETWHPHEAAVEETFINRDPQSAMRLGYARAIALLAPALYNLEVGHYAPTSVKKAIVGNGRAPKESIGIMVRCLLPTMDSQPGTDAMDALAIAITHAYHRYSPLHLYNQVHRI